MSVQNELVARQQTIEQFERDGNLHWLTLD